MHHRVITRPRQDAPSTRPGRRAAAALATFAACVLPSFVATAAAQSPSSSAAAADSAPEVVSPSLASRTPMRGSSMAAQASERVLRFDPARPIPPFTLLDQDGLAFRSDRALRGRVTLVYFGFTQCPDICPTTLLKLQHLVASDPVLADVQVLMISVDGARDSPAAMKAFLAPISPRFVGLTGTVEQVSPVARAFSAAFSRQPAAGGGYTVEHSAQVFLVDRSGRLTELFFNAPEEGMRDALRVALR